MRDGRGIAMGLSVPDAVLIVFLALWTLGMIVWLVLVRLNSRRIRAASSRVVHRSHSAREDREARLERARALGADEDVFLRHGILLIVNPGRVGRPRTTAVVSLEDIDERRKRRGPPRLNFDEIHDLLKESTLRPEKGDSIEMLGDDMACPICLDEMVPGNRDQRVVLLPGCDHAFHKRCVRSHLHRGVSNRCPLCQSDVAEVYRARITPSSPESSSSDDRIGSDGTENGTSYTVDEASITLERT